MPSSASRIVPFSPADVARSYKTVRKLCGSSTRVKRYAETLRTEGTDPAYVGAEGTAARPIDVGPARV